MLAEVVPLATAPEIGPEMRPASPVRRSTSADSGAPPVFCTVADQRSTLCTRSSVMRVVATRPRARVVTTIGAATGALPATNAGVVIGASRRAPDCSKAYAIATRRVSVKPLPKSSTPMGSPSPAKPAGTLMLGSPLCAPRLQVLPFCTSPTSVGFCRTVGYAMASSRRLSRMRSMRARSAACRASAVRCCSLSALSTVSITRKRTSSCRSYRPRSRMSRSDFTGALGTVRR